MTWFETTAKANFEKHLFEAKPEWCLQLGAWTGDATLWMLENLPNVRIQDVDNWQGSDEHAEFDMGEVRRTYNTRTEQWRGTRRLKFSKWSTADFLREQEPGVNRYDFIYIDADHHAAAVLQDAVLAWPLLHEGGLMAFDDYTWGPTLKSYERPVTGINAFILAYGDQFDVVERNSQLWVKKL